MKRFISNFFKRESDFSRRVRLMQEEEAEKLEHMRRQIEHERAVIKREADKLRAGMGKRFSA